MLQRSPSPSRASALLPDQLKHLALEDGGREWTPDSQESGVEDGDRMPPSEAVKKGVGGGYQTSPSEALKNWVQDAYRTPPSDSERRIVEDVGDDEEWKPSYDQGSGVEDICQEDRTPPLNASPDAHSQWSADEEAKFIDLFLDYSMDAFKSADALNSAHSACDMEMVYERQSKEFADLALQHYNDDPINEIKYELIKAVGSCTIMDYDGSYGHVNFTAKAKVHGSQEELFFAEICCGSDTCTCVVSLKLKRKIGGRPYFEGDYNMVKDELPVDNHNCYACGDELKHPEHGASYKAGHVVLRDYYDYA